MPNGTFTARETTEHATEHAARSNAGWSPALYPPHADSYAASRASLASARSAETLSPSPSATAPYLSS